MGWGGRRVVAVEGGVGLWGGCAWVGVEEGGGRKGGGRGMGGEGRFPSTDFN